MGEREGNKTGLIFAAILTVQTLGMFLTDGIHSVIAPLTSLMTFVCFGIMLAEKVFGNFRGSESPGTALAEFGKDHEFWIVAGGSIVALLNLFLIGSNKGAFLTAADVLLMTYLVKDFFPDEKIRFYVCALYSALLIWWYCTVRWYFNFNMTGFVFMLTAVFSILLMEVVKKTHEGFEWLSFVQLIQFVVAFLLCLLYHSRCVMAGVLILGLLYLMMPLIASKKALRILLVFFATVGSLLFTLMYMLMDRLDINITFLYKDILSGRQDIWKELWEAFLQMPLTGIGSSYQMKSFFMFEVHNGLFDILAVHGIIVFCCVIYLLIKRLYEVLTAFSVCSGDDMWYNYRRICASAVFAILFTSFFENFFINSPYLLLLMVLMSGMKMKEK